MTFADAVAGGVVDLMLGQRPHRGRVVGVHADERELHAVAVHRVEHRPGWVVGEALTGQVPEHVGRRVRETPERLLVLEQRTQAVAPRQVARGGRQADHEVDD
ncbi:MAG: hypothetical protein ACKOA9_03160, partial [Actinomycetota bacterium]